MKMTPDNRDVWPDDVPIGTFHIEDGGVQGYPAATAHIQFVCPNRQRCAVLLGPSHIDRPTPDALPIWGWNGDHSRPTITPSINCVQKHNPETGEAIGGCGWHGFITNGEIG